MILCLQNTGTIKSYIPLHLSGSHVLVDADYAGLVSISAPFREHSGVSRLISRYFTPRRSFPSSFRRVMHPGFIAKKKISRVEAHWYYCPWLKCPFIYVRERISTSEELNGMADYNQWILLCFPTCRLQEAKRSLQHTHENDMLLK